LERQQRELTAAHGEPGELEVGRFHCQVRLPRAKAGSDDANHVAGRHARARVHGHEPDLADRVVDELGQDHEPVPSPGCP